MQSNPLNLLGWEAPPLKRNAGNFKLKSPPLSKEDLSRSLKIGKILVLEKSKFFIIPIFPKMKISSFLLPSYFSEAAIKIIVTLVFNPSNKLKKSKESQIEFILILGEQVALRTQKQII